MFELVIAAAVEGVMALTAFEQSFLRANLAGLKLSTAELLAHFIIQMTRFTVGFYDKVLQLKRGEKGREINIKFKGFKIIDYACL